MLFYADHSHAINLTDTAWQVSSSLAAIAERYRSNCESPYLIAIDTHAELVAALVTLGEAHQALADQLCPELDDETFETERMASLELLLGRCLYRSAGLLRSRGGTHNRDLPELLDAAAAAASRIASLGCASHLTAKVTEGYAFYSLYPEMYLDSLSRALAAGPNCSSYIVIGIRSIGTSLAGIVAGALIEKGFGASSITIRPRGNPFDRYVDLSTGLKTRLVEAANSGSGFAVVDEGPGLSCSSFLSVCTALETMGIERERITLLSAWQGNPSGYASDELRHRWNSARVFHTPPEEAFDGWRALIPFVHRSLARSSGENGHSTLHAVEIADLSYGRWRERCFPTPDRWPVVHQAMERTKLLVQLPCMRSHPPIEARDNIFPLPIQERDNISPLPMGEENNIFPLPMGEGQGEGMVIHHPNQPSPNAAGKGGYCLLAKFAGLGDYGREKLERAQIVADAGFGLPALGLAYGFLLHPFIEELRPLSAGELTPGVMVRLVDYYDFIRRQFSRPSADRFDNLIEMIEVNAERGLGLDLSEFFNRWRQFQSTIDRLPLVLLDGKPQPYEWLSGTVMGQSMLVKADNSDHFKDHSLVGEQSILWDLAGACEEWEMDDRQVSSFMSLWARKTGDLQAAGLLDFFRVAYLSFRVAAVHYAIHGAGDEETRRSLQLQQTAYAERLKKIATGNREPDSDV